MCTNVPRNQFHIAIQYLNSHTFMRKSRKKFPPGVGGWVGVGCCLRDIEVEVWEGGGRVQGIGKFEFCRGIQTPPSPSRLYKTMEYSYTILIIIV